MQKLIIDTDPGQDIDDLLAIWFALVQPSLDVRAITTVTWPATPRARLIRRLLRYLGRQDIPVAAGMQIPLRPFPPQEMASQRDLKMCMNHYAFAQPEDPQDEPAADDAVTLLIRTIRAHAGQIALACIAPLTNIACALRRDPDIAGMIQYIALMGGETVLHQREHNIAFDYVAADIVLTAGIPLVMGTWSVTRQFTLTMEDCRRFHSSPSAVVKAMGQAIELWHPAQSWKPGPVMYDLFPILHSVDPSYYTLKPMRVEVETSGRQTQGMTVVTQGEPNAQVTTAIRAAAVRELYLAALAAAR